MNEFYLRVMKCMEDNNESLWWRTDEEYAPITFLINCSDAFWWGCSDAEEITEENIDILEQSIKDAGDPRLFCARVRGMRPQGAMYKYIETKNRHFFDACGPEREIEIGNPCEQKEWYMEEVYRKQKEESVRVGM
jgi:hypothetical protein